MIQVSVSFECGLLSFPSCLCDSDVHVFLAPASWLGFFPAAASSNSLEPRDFKRIIQ